MQKLFILLMKEKDMTDIQTNSATKKLDDPDIRLADTALRRAARLKGS